MLHPNNHIKSFQSIYSLRTHKLIKLQLEKEEFFQQLTRNLQAELTIEEYQFLMEYILKDKFNDRAEARLFRNTQTSNKNKSDEQNPTIDCIHSDVFQSSKNLIKHRKFNNFSITEQDYQKIRKKKHESKSHTQVYQPCKSDDKNTRISYLKFVQSKYGNNYQKKDTKAKQNRWQNIGTQNESKVPALKMISRQYLLKNYKNSFISNIFDRSKKENSNTQSVVDQTFQDNFSNRVTQQIERQKQTQKKYRHLTSIRFERSPRQRPPVKVHNRRF